MCLTKTVQRLIGDAATHPGENFRFVLFPHLTYGDYVRPPAAETFLKELLPEVHVERISDESPPVPGAEVFRLRNHPAEKEVRLEVVPI